MSTLKKKELIEITIEKLMCYPRIKHKKVFKGKQHAARAIGHVIDFFKTYIVDELSLNKKVVFRGLFTARVNKEGNCYMYIRTSTTFAKLLADDDYYVFPLQVSASMTEGLSEVLELGDISIVNLNLIAGVVLREIANAVLIDRRAVSIHGLFKIEPRTKPAGSRFDINKGATVSTPEMIVPSIKLSRALKELVERR